MKLLSVLLTATCLSIAQPTGTVDTVGGTTFDNQNSVPALQWVAQDPANGIHVIWLYSAQPYGSTWPDRTIRYNYFDRTTGTWNWNDPDFMASGINSQTRRTGYGSLELNPADGAALVACHYSAGGMPPTFVPIVARDAAPGGGIFSYCDGAPDLEGFFLPVVAVTADGTTHLFIIKFAVSDNLFYARGTTWCDWETPSGWIQTGAFGHNLVASHVSNKLMATWMSGRNAEMALHYRRSVDAGENWGPVTTLVPPDAFLGDTGTVCAIGAGLVMDRGDNPLLVTTLVPLIGDSAYSNPAEIWLYDFGSETWSRIHRAGSHNLAGGFGANAAICGRPSIGQNPENGRLYVVWEQFDSLNVEPSTDLLRADVFLSCSDDGLFWTEPFKLTPTDETSKRFPVVARNCAGDSAAIFFEQDVIAGFNSDDVGQVSNNPICVWRGHGTGIAERRDMTELPGNSDRVPSIGRQFTFSSPNASSVQILDVSGRLVRTLQAVSCQPPALSFFLWDGTDARGNRAQPGCYFARSREMTQFHSGNWDRVPRLASVAKLVLLP
ncbi:hypothetical protein FJY69_10490 [candidate division WOR-3 bacterium]|nr:hypothetical protein [candidate division WOR-3 bacterium]